MAERKPWELTDEEMASVISKESEFKPDIETVMATIRLGFCESETIVAQAAQRKLLEWEWVPCEEHGQVSGSGLPVCRIDCTECVKALRKEFRFD